MKICECENDISFRKKSTYYKIEDNSLKTSEVFVFEMVEEGEEEGTV
jgi:hypothetical protein